VHAAAIHIQHRTIDRGAAGAGAEDGEFGDFTRFDGPAERQAGSPTAAAADLAYVRGIAILA
jgi:hypothetical protein